MTDVGGFLQRFRRLALDTAPSYRGRVNDASLQWCMTAPDTPDERLTLEDFLQRPGWQQDAARRGQGVKAFFSGSSADIGPRQSRLPRVRRAGALPPVRHGGPGPRGRLGGDDGERAARDAARGGGVVRRWCALFVPFWHR